MLLSIIIPAFNVAKYLAPCLDSCLHQVAPAPAAADAQPVGPDPGADLRPGEVEIIVVDDGSTDATPRILRDYASAHPCLHVLRQANQGQSVARNLAIAQARGEYIYMVDSDDQMMRGSHCVLPVATMRRLQYDIIGLQVCYQPEQGPRRPWSRQTGHWPFDRPYPSGADFLRTHNIEGLVYGYVFRRQLFTRHPELRFTPGIYHQDEELVFRAFTLAGPVIYRRGYTYLYFEHTGSSIHTRTAQRKRKLMDDNLVVLRQLVAWRERFGPADPRTPQLREAMHHKLSFLSMDVLRVLIRRSYEVDYALTVVDALRQLGLYPLPPLRHARYLVMKLLTQSPAFLRFWLTHPTLSQRIGF